MVAVAAETKKGGIPVVCESMKKDPAIQPGEGARAIDTFHPHYITAEEFGQAFESAKNFLEQQYGETRCEDYFDGYATLTSYLAGYAANMPLGVAFEGVRKILHERYGLKDE
jgi:hypothetical protein